MALKHLKDAVELLRAGMPVAEITAIVRMPEDQAAAPGPEPEGQPADEPEAAPATPEEDKPAAPAPDPKPTQRPEVNNNPSTLVDDLNKIF